MSYSHPAKIWFLIILLFTLAILPLLPKSAFAVLSLRDHLSTVLPNTPANHELSWQIADSGGIAEGQGFAINFESTFNTASISVGDVELSSNGSPLSLAPDCTGSEKVGFINNNDSFTFTICPGDGGAVASGTVITIKIGTHVAGGTNQITNPLASGGYLIYMDGIGGYSDADKLQIVIMSGVTTTVQIGPQTGNLRLIGYASPLAVVFFLESGSVIGTQVANSSSLFDKTLTGLEEGIHFISIYATDSGSRSTLTITFSVNVIANVTTIVSGIILPPTISLASNNVKRPAVLTAQGKAINNASVQVFIQGTGDNMSNNVVTNSDGDWTTNINPKLHLGNKTTYSLALDNLGGQSEYSQTRAYEVLLSADLNVDNLVNLTDFSILMFNYGTSSPPNVVADINDNGPVNLVDFSVMMFYWTGG